ncbi:MAG TPA: RNA methyltransferase [Bacteroidales bacterium]|mgnify:FL=1|jgi:tRNA G18 (ribose-2'-O)-methylase SpoU|nr:RNA methyltransferase [Bacteroidales bacterium]
MKKLSLEELQRIDIETFKNSKKLPVIIILDNIRSQFNIGSIFRTCDAFRVEELILCGITAQPPSREIEKSALGATQSVQWKYFKTTQDAIDYCKNKSFFIAAIEQTDESIDIRNFKINTPNKYAFIFGNEVNGVDQNIINQCDFCIEIPQFGTKHSFNVAVTSGIVLYDFFVKQSVSPIF